MKKFKLIKPYPNNPKLGVEVVYSEMYNNYFPVEGDYNSQRTKNEVENYPEFWEEVSEAEKEYEIMSFSYEDRIDTRRENNLFGVSTGMNPQTTGYYGEEVYKGSWKIHSVKRLSDGKIFTIGDKVCWDWSGCSVKYFVIDALRLSFDESEIILEFEKRNVFEGLFNDEKFNLRHYKEPQPLFKTKDGVDVFEGDVYYSINCDLSKIFSSMANKHFNFVDCLRFSTEEAAEEYIKMNRPEFSRNQIIKMIDKAFPKRISKEFINDYINKK